MAGFSVEMPDGTVIEDIPEGTSKAELERKWKMSGGTAPPGFVDRSIERVKQGGRDVLESLSEPGPGLDQAVKGGDLGYSSVDRVSRALFNDIPNAAGDIVGDAMMSAGKAVLPKTIQQGLSQASEYVGTSAPVQAIGRGLESWKEAHPSSYETAGQSLNIAAVLGMRPKLPTTNLGGKGKRALDKALNNERIKDVARTLEPERMDGPGEVFTNKLKTKKYRPSDRETEIINQVSELEDYAPRRNYTDNVKVVEVAEEKLREQLNQGLEGLPGIDATSVRASVQATADKLENVPALSGAPGEAAKKIYKEFDRLLGDVSVDGFVSPRDLIQVRRDLDKWMTDFSGNIFDTTSVTANKIAGRELRGVVNDIVDAAAPTQAVKDTLRKQSNLLTARETLKARSLAEANTAVGRLSKNVEKATGITHPTTPLAAKITLSDIPIAMAAAVGGITTAAGRMAWDQTRKRLVDLLKATDIAINKGGPLATQLKADRAVLLSLINSGKEEK